VPLVAPIDERLKELIAEVVAEHEMTVHSLEAMLVRVRLFVEADPMSCVAEIVDRFKGLPTLWNRSYYAGSVGAVSEAGVRRFIEAQRGA
jgi:putative transposase